MRTYCRLILLASLLLLCGCVRERTDGDIVVLNFRWWAMLWGFAVPLLLFGAILAQHTRTWINGKWIPWWRFYGWDAYEWGYAAGTIALCGVGFATVFDRFEVTPTYMRESNLSPGRGLRRVAFSDIQRIELPPQEKEDFLSSLKNRRRKKPPAMHIVFKDGRQEDFDGWLVRRMQSTIVDHARQAGAAVDIRAQSFEASESATPQQPRPNVNQPRGRPDFDPFEKGQPVFTPTNPKQ